MNFLFTVGLVLLASVAAAALLGLILWFAATLDRALRDAHDNRPQTPPEEDK